VRQEECFLIFFVAFLPLLILEHFIPSLWNFHSSPVQVRRLVLTIIGTMVFLDDVEQSYLLSINGTKACQQKRALVHLVTDEHTVIKVIEKANVNFERSTTIALNT